MSVAQGGTIAVEVGSSGGLLEWLWRSAALRAARARVNPSGLRRERLRRARLASELADGMLSSDDLLEAGSALSVALAVSLYREAAYWSVAAHSGEEPLRAYPD